MTVKVYDADQMTVSIAGIPLKGYADGEFLSIAYENNLFDDVVGTDGDTTRSKTNDRRATITINLMQTSDSNDLLSALFNADSAAPNGAGIGALLIRDRQGRTVYSASEAWIMQMPPASFDRTATERAWEIRVGELVSFVGGN